MEIALPWVWNPSSWGGTQNFLFSLKQKKHLLAPSILVDALFQCTCPLLVANFQGPSVWNHPIDVDIKSSLSLFKKEMKQHFIKDY